MTRNRIEFKQLPSELSSIFSESEFITGYDCSEDGALIIWVFDESIGKQREVEFSLLERRVLSRDERSRNFPPRREVLLPSQRLMVFVGYRLEQYTDVRYETYDVYLEGESEKSIVCEQIYYSSALIDVGDLIRSALDIATFPATYSGWSIQERVNYWCAALYRLRHRTCEQGALEDDIFDRGLIAKMRSIDQDVDSIFPVILKRLAVMESRDVDSLFQTFNLRTGMAIIP